MKLAFGLTLCGLKDVTRAIVRFPTGFWVSVRFHPLQTLCGSKTAIDPWRRLSLFFIFHEVLRSNTLSGGRGGSVPTGPPRPLSKRRDHYPPIKLLGELLVDLAR